MKGKQLLQTKMTPVGFEPTQLALVELESTPLDHSGKVSWWRSRSAVPACQSDELAKRACQAAMADWEKARHTDDQRV